MSIIAGTTIAAAANLGSANLGSTNPGATIAACPPPYRITVDLAALAGNWRALANLLGQARCAAVVKADGYGLGAARVIPTLAQAGCQTFFVATLAEAAEARALAPTAEIYALDGLLAGSAAPFAALGLRPVLSSLEEVREWANFCRDQGGTRYPAALHIDSGLNRLGLSAAEIAAAVATPGLLEAFETTLIMSHLASADEATDPKNEAQRRAFLANAAGLPAAPRSLAASDGLLLGSPYHFDLVRPGYALYGGQPSRAFRAPVAPVVTVEARVLQVRDVAQGETVGYSATWTAQRPSRVAILAGGYADGIGRSSSATNIASGGAVAFGGRLAPIVGRVSMDLITVDVTDLSATDANSISAPRPPQRGDMAEIVGPTLSLEDVGRAGGTIGYEVLTRLSRRAERIYLDRNSQDRGRDG
jgi:alanine racemase